MFDRKLNLDFERNKVYDVSGYNVEASIAVGKSRARKFRAKRFENRRFKAPLIERLVGMIM